MALSMGAIGAFIPVMPSTCFFILAAYFFGKSSQKLESWILNHPKFGPTVTAWRSHRSMTRTAKLAAYTGMLIGQSMLLVSWPDHWIVVIGTVIIGASVTYIWTRPLYDQQSC